MNGDTPQKKSVRVALTKDQGAEGLGRALVDLSRAWIAGGEFRQEDLEKLKAWLATVKSDSLPAIQFLKDVIRHYPANRALQEWELRHIQVDLIRVLPKKEREEAKAAYQTLVHAAWAQHAPEREAARLASAEHSRDLRKRYAHEWARQPATEEQLDFILRLGGNLPAAASKLEASDMINRLLGRSVKTKSGCFSMFVLLVVFGFGAAYFSLS
jgi:hypothetical protein